MSGRATDNAQRGKPPLGKYGGSDGFGLLEVLVATTLVGLMLVVLLQVLGATWRTQESVWQHTRALFVAEKVLQENCELVKLTAGVYQGRDDHGFDYRVRVTPQYEVGEHLDGRGIICALIQVTVFWKERGQTKSLVLETVRTAAQKQT